VRWIDCPPVNPTGFHQKFDGIEWRYDATGVFVYGREVPERTSGEPTTCRVICELLGTSIIERSIEFGVPAELIVMTIATEASQYRSTGFSGPPTFRWEAKVVVQDSPPKFKGDYSVGPMQTLATTAREIIRLRKLPYDGLACFPAIRVQPPTSPLEMPGYEPRLNIHVGVAEIFSRWARTGDDPILVAAAYNSGGI
jgi:peptidoglycan L-alanyl-D-glutamate endopeptidase CwlK